MFERLGCNLCPMHKGAIHPCLPGVGSLTSGARILVLIDNPTLVEDRAARPMSGDGVSLVKWMFTRMGLGPDNYYLEYVIKCYPPGGKLPKGKADRMVAIETCSQYRHGTLQMGAFPVTVSLGRLACEALLGSHEVSKYDGTFWTPTEVMTRMYSPVVWIGPNVNAVVMAPAQAGELFRVLWAAALQAKYNPVLTKVPNFDWSEFIR